jgi:hypothetical protein
MPVYPIEVWVTKGAERAFTKHVEAIFGRYCREAPNQLEKVGQNLGKESTPKGVETRSRGV